MNNFKSLKKIFKWLIFLLLFLIIFFAVWQFDLLRYGWYQAKGQYYILVHARPVKNIIKDSAFPDSLKRKLMMVQKLRSFAFDSLGLTYSDNYTDYYQQSEKPSLLVLTACERFALVPKEWWFPVVGNVSYKGFFDHIKAEAEEKELISQGYDTDLGAVSGWSTLGYFKDPVLSGMLRQGEGRLANLIIHELVHSTVYFSDSMAFNENLANFIADKATPVFISQMYGIGSPQLKTYLSKAHDEDVFVANVLKYTAKLDSLYSGFEAGLPEKQKQAQKNQLMQAFVNSIAGLPLDQPQRYLTIFESGELPNNTFFLDYAFYEDRQEELEQVFLNACKGDLRCFIEQIKHSAP